MIKKSLLIFIFLKLFSVDFKYFTSDEIAKIYEEKVKKSINYFTKYERLPLFRNNKRWRWEGKDAPRVWCVLDFADWIKKYQINQIHDLGVTAATDPEIEYVEYKNITIIDFDARTSRGDLHTDHQANHNKFDFFIFNETIEHLYNPFLAVSYIYKMVKPGGYVFTSVPFMNIPHDLPWHFNGYRPLGLTMLFATCGFDIKEVGQWGNYDYISAIFKYHQWPDYRFLMRNGIIRNEEKNVARCWILAQKPK